MSPRPCRIVYRNGRSQGLSPYSSFRSPRWVRQPAVEGDEIFHAHSTYGRGTDQPGNTCTLLDLSALGRQEDWEEPTGRVAPIRGSIPAFTS